MNKLYKRFNIPFTKIYLIRWNPNAVTAIHHHPNVDCNLMVLKGTIQEEVFRVLKEDGYYMRDMKILKENQSSHINDTIGQHRIKNLSDSHAWSLHYNKGIVSM